VETGRWVVRAANTGLTMVVDPRGRVRVTVAPRSERLLVSQAARVRRDTFYTQRGDVFAGAVLLALLGMILVPARAGLAAELRTPAFQLAAVTVALPFISVYLLLGTRAAWAWALLLVLFLAVFSRLRPPAGWGLHLRGAGMAALLGLGAVIAPWTGLALAFRAYDLPVGIPVPPGGWVTGALTQLFLALASEAWLRGVAFASLADWKGTGVAVVITTVLGVLLYRGLGAEPMAWALLTGTLFGLIRARTGNALGLVIPHAVGNVLFSTVTLLR
jgi:hypothetical protein